MLRFLFSSVKSGIEKITSNTQLIYTIIMAVLITASFVFMSEAFIKIATTAEERLINVRIGSLQDAFVSFAQDKMGDPEYLNERIRDMMKANETIKSFKVIVKNAVVASGDSSEIGKLDDTNSLLYSLASGNPANSLTESVVGNGERLFKTARAIVDRAGNVLGVAITTQTLSEADMAIQKSISNSRILLFSVLLLVLVLFLRHSKIIDYADLYKKLKEVDQMKDDFISMASHELRTPLTVIRGYAEYISEAPELSSETKDYAAKIDASSKDLDSLISDILDVSRIDQGRMSFEFERIDPSEIVAKVVESLVLPAREKGLSVSFDRSKAGNYFINADPNRLKQVLVNLVGNAVKYTNKGEVVVKQYEEKGRLRIMVSDTGIGMTEDERDKLFEKFYRIKNEETKDVRGTGLGLWIAAKIIKEMNGKISVESIKGVGSHFIVSFPIIK